MKRTIREIDIARMSSLKSAIEIVSAFRDSITAEGTDGVVTTTLKTADKLYDWILQPEEQLQDAAGYDVPAPPAPEPRRDPTEYDESRGQSMEASSAGKAINVQRLSKKQYGYLVSLYRKLGQEPDYDSLNWMSSKEASSIIEELLYQTQKHGGNGSRPH